LSSVVWKEWKKVIEVIVETVTVGATNLRDVEAGLNVGIIPGPSLQSSKEATTKQTPRTEDENDEHVVSSLTVNDIPEVYSLDDSQSELCFCTGLVTFLDL
jgi:hypothetical protein